jgi:hypothetical protein
MILVLLAGNLRLFLEPVAMMYKAAAVGDVKEDIQGGSKEMCPP